MFFSRSPLPFLYLFVQDREPNHLACLWKRTAHIVLLYLLGSTFVLLRLIRTTIVISRIAWTMLQVLREPRILPLWI